MARTKRKVNPLVPVAEQAAPLPRIYNVGGYVRLSVEDSGKKDPDTIEVQQEWIEHYIAAQPDMNLCHLYRDNGRTGTNFQRPGFERLMEDVRAGKIDCIVVKDLSRFGRNYIETGNYLEQVFPFLGVRFVAINESFDTLTAERGSDGYIVPLKNIINDAYSKDISRKVSSALAVKQKAGEFIGSWAAYGYRKCAEDKHRVEPNPDTAPVVRDIFMWRLEKMSYNKIAKRLNDDGIITPSRYLYQIGLIKTKNYYCMTHKLMENVECIEVHISEKELQSSILESLRIQAAIAVDREKLLTERCRAVRQEAKSTQNQLAALHETQEQYARESRELYESFALGYVDKADYLAQKSVLMMKKDELAVQITKLQGKVDSKAEERDNAFIEKFKGFFEAGDVPDDMLRDLLKVVRVFPGGRMVIEWNYADAFMTKADIQL